MRVLHSRGRQRQLPAEARRFACTSLCRKGVSLSAGGDRPGEVYQMKRVKAACILQTLVFAQKAEMGYSKERAARLNREEIDHYKQTLERARTKYVIVDEAEQEDGSIVVHVKKQYNDKADVSEYFH